LKKVVLTLEANEVYKTIVLCEPQLGKRGLYPTVSQKGTYSDARIIQNFVAYADGKSDLIDISNVIDASVEVLANIAEKLITEKIIEKIKE